jgi:hypothetical protein
MPSERVHADRWTWLIEDRLRFFLRKDELPDSEKYTPALDYGVFTGPDPDLNLPADVEMLEVRTQAPCLAGWRLQFRYGKRLYLPSLEARLSLIDTDQFRADDLEARFESRRRLY